MYWNTDDNDNVICSTISGEYILTVVEYVLMKIIISDIISETDLRG